MGFKPGPTVSGPETETAKQVYDELSQLADLNYREAEDEAERLSKAISDMYGSEAMDLNPGRRRARRVRRVKRVRRVRRPRR